MLLRLPKGVWVVLATLWTALFWIPARTPRPPNAFVDLAHPFEGLPTPQISVLIATSLGTHEMETFLDQAATYRNTTVRLKLNAYQGSEAAKAIEVAVHERGLDHMLVGGTITTVPGSKALFWKRELQPEKLLLQGSGFDYLWLLDADVRYGQPHFDLKTCLAHGALSGSPLFQPSIMKRADIDDPNSGTAHPHLRHDAAQTAAAAISRVCFVDIMTPFLSPDFYTFIYENFLVHADDDTLYKTAWVSVGWCQAAAHYLGTKRLDSSPLWGLHGKESFLRPSSRRIKNKRFNKASAKNPRLPFGLLNATLLNSSSPSLVANVNAMNLSVNPCSVIHATPILHMDSRAFQRDNKNDTRELAQKNWYKLTADLDHWGPCDNYAAREAGLKAVDFANLTNQKEAITKATAFAKSARFLDDLTTLAATRNPQRLQTGARQSKYRQKAASIYDAHRAQTPIIAASLRQKWMNRPAIGKIDPWQAFLLTKKVFDESDNNLMGISMYVHGLQVFEAMKRDKVSDSRLLFLALYHDVGKLALLDGQEEPANVVCTNDAVFLKDTNQVVAPANFANLTHGTGLELTLDTQFGHDDIIYYRLKDHLPFEVSWVLRYHSFSPLLRGHLTHVLSPKEREAYKLLMAFWKYDHKFKVAMHEPVVDLEEVEQIIRGYLPGEIVL